MSTKKPKRYLLTVSIIGILIAFGCISLINSLGKENSSEKSPIRTLLIQIDEDVREELFSQLRKFSEEYGLEFYLSFYKNKEVFLVVMYGNRLEISAQPIPESPKEIRVDFYEQDPSNPPSQAIVDELFGDIKVRILEIPNVNIIEEN